MGFEARKVKVKQIEPVKQREKRFRQLTKKLQTPQQGPDASYIDEITGSKSVVRGLQPAAASSSPPANWPTFWVTPDSIEKREKTNEMLGSAVSESVQQWNKYVERQGNLLSHQIPHKHQQHQDHSDQNSTRPGAFREVKKGSFYFNPNVFQRTSGFERSDSISHSPTAPKFETNYDKWIVNRASVLSAVNESLKSHYPKKYLHKRKSMAATSLRWNKPVESLANEFEMSEKESTM